MAHIQTDVIHQGANLDSTYSSITAPIYTSSIFAAADLNERPQFDYTRSGNPTRKALEDTLACLESGAMASATASGMSAIMAALFLLKSGDHLIAPKGIYGGTHRILCTIMQKFGIQITFLSDLNNLEQINKNIQANTKMIWVETPSNPLLHITDIQALTNFVKALNPNILLVADNTFLSPYFQKPLELGCDLVIHSTTKYINGHSDVIGGAVIAKTESLGQEIANYVNCLGLASSPFDAWLVLRGLKTLPQRMEAHQQNALKLAQFLSEQICVKKVFYTGLSSHPQFELIKKQMLGFGGMLSFELDLEKADINKFFQSLKYFSLAVSLGGVESLIAQPWSMSHASMPEQARIEAGLTPAIIRVSVGIENSEDLICDLQNALEACCNCCC